MMKPWIAVLLAFLVVLINLLNWVKQVSCMTQGVFGILPRGTNFVCFKTPNSSNEGI
jgi:hypothetical protein